MKVGGVQSSCCRGGCVFSHGHINEKHPVKILDIKDYRTMFPMDHYRYCNTMTPSSVLWSRLAASSWNFLYSWQGWWSTVPKRCDTPWWVKFEVDWRILAGECLPIWKICSSNWIISLGKGWQQYLKPRAKNRIDIYICSRSKQVWWEVLCISRW